MGSLVRLGSSPRAVIVAIAIVLSGVAAVEAQTTLDIARCRNRIGRGVRRLAEAVVNARETCHRVRMLGQLPASVDCNDPAQSPASSKVARAKTTLARLTARCTSVPAAFGYFTCPSPCDETAITDLASVSTCLACFTEASAGAAVTEAYGVPPQEGSSTPPTLCQGNIGSALRVYLKTRVKEQQRCQFDEDRSPSGADCRSADQRGKIADARTSADNFVARCTGAAIAALDTCGSNIASVQSCVEGQGLYVADALFDAVYFPAAPTPTPTSTGTPTETPSPTATPTTDPSTPSPTETSTITPTAAPTSTATATALVVTVSATAYRPQSESYGGPIDRRAVPDAQEVSPGAGIRINGDDDNGNGVADRNDTSVSGENDLIELSLGVSHAPAPAGVEYVVRRSNSSLKVWSAQTKGSAILNANDEAVMPFSSGTPQSVWVENPNGGSADIEIIARTVPGGTVLSSDLVHFYPFTSVVIALGGEGQSPSDPPDSNHGMFNIAVNLYAMGYDVHMYDEDDVDSSGAGPTYDEVVRAVQSRGVSIVSVFGYSHGGGSTYDLVERLNNNRGSIGTFTIPYTAYVDAIENDSDIDIQSERRLPPTTAYHVNYYQRNDLFIKGNSVSGADVNVNVGDTGWGGDLVHGEIDDHPNVRSAVQDPLVQRVAK